MSLAVLSPSAAIAAKRSKDLQLLDVQFGSIEANPVPGDGPPTGKKLAWELRPVQAMWGRVGGDVFVVLPFTVDISAAADNEHVRVAVIGLVMRVLYQLGGDPWDDESLGHSLGILGYLHAWPYVRAEVQALTTKLGLPTLVLPVSLAGHAEKFVTMTKVPDEGSTPSPVLPSGPTPAKAKPKRKKRTAQT